VKIVKVAPLTLTVELDPTDCIALAIFAPDTDQERTFAHLWRVWAPLVYTGFADGRPTYGRMPVPPEYAD